MRNYRFHQNLLSQTILYDLRNFKGFYFYLRVILKSKNNVFYLFLNKKANTFDHNFIRHIDKKITEVQKNPGPTALVTISLSKLFSGGFDFNYLSNLDNSARKWLILQFTGLLGKFSVLPFPTIAIVNGGAVAAGSVFSFAHDFIYADDSAFFLCNQVNLGMSINLGGLEVIKKKHNSFQTLRDMILFSKKFTSKQAMTSGIIDGVIQQSKIFEIIKQKAENLTKYGTNKQALKQLKQNLYKDVVNSCFNKQQIVGIDKQFGLSQKPKL